MTKSEAKAIWLDAFAEAASYDVQFLSMTSREEQIDGAVRVANDEVRSVYRARYGDTASVRFTDDPEPLELKVQ